MRDELIEKIHDFFGADSMYFGVDAAALADHLLADGWIRRPCKVGDKVYSCIGREYYVRRITIKDGMPTTFLLESGLHGQLCVTESDFGSLVFLSREQAKQARAERSTE